MKQKSGNRENVPRSRNFRLIIPLISELNEKGMFVCLCCLHPPQCPSTRGASSVQFQSSVLAPVNPRAMASVQGLLWLHFLANNFTTSTGRETCLEVGSVGGKMYV